MSVCQNHKLVLCKCNTIVSDCRCSEPKMVERVDCCDKCRDFSQSMDARRWARAFVERAKQNPNLATDEGTMIGWFANAIMRGFDEANGWHKFKADVAAEKAARESKQ